MNAIDIATRSIEDIQDQVSRIDDSTVKLTEEYANYRMTTAHFRRELELLKAQRNAYQQSLSTIMKHCNDYKMYDQISLDSDKDDY